MIIVKATTESSLVVVDSSASLLGCDDPTGRPLHAMGMGPRIILLDVQIQQVGGVGSRCHNLTK